MRKNETLTIVSTSYPIRPGSVSGTFVHDLVQELSGYHDIRVVVPADTSNEPAVSGNPKISVDTIRYAPAIARQLFHGAGGLPSAIKRNPLLALLIFPFILTLFIRLLSCPAGLPVVANWSLSGLVAGLAGRIRGIPVILVLRGSDVHGGQSITGKLVLLTAIRLSARVIVVSENFLDSLKSGHASSADKFRFVPNGVNNSLLDSDPVYDIAHGKIVVIGNLTDNKRTADVIRAVAQIRQDGLPKLMIIGDGPNRINLENLVKEFKLSGEVIFSGRLQQEEVYQHLRDAAIYINASENEGRSNALLEAMAAARPIITSDILANTELIQNTENGLTFPVADISKLADAIAYLRNNPEIAKSLGRQARKTIIDKKLTWKNTAQQYNKIIEEIS